MKNKLIEKLNKIELVIFDLDGTLYEDTDHFDYYAECLAEQLEPGKREEFWDDLQKSRTGGHPVKIGRVYDVEEDLILQITIDGEVLNGWNWSGEKLSNDKMNELYPEKISCNMYNKIYLGDGWWPPAAIAYHYGLESTEACYLKTKEWINNNDDFLQPTPGLRETLKNLKINKNIVLATNSDAQDTNSILNNLDLQGVFQDIYTSCNKPENSFKLFNNIIDEYDCSPEDILSIGDNYLNEIGPVIQLGGEAILIDREDAFSQKDSSAYIVDSIKELVPIFNNAVE